MHEFFSRKEEQGPFEVPPVVYARLIDGEEGDDYVLFDAIDARDFDEYLIAGGLDFGPETWREVVDALSVYAIQVNKHGQAPDAARWLSDHPIAELPEWSVILLREDQNGAAEVYDNIAGPPTLASLTVKPASADLIRCLKKATDLTPHVKADSLIENALPSQPIEEIFVLDVGQGSANALVTASGDVVAYVDLGAGVLKDAGTWPSAMGGICLTQSPVVILTHWHYDHFQAANIYPLAQGLTWIAPLQTLGPGPQTAMAKAIIHTGPGSLMVWNGASPLSVGAIELERCTGPAGNQNRTGIAVWVSGPVGSDPILLPGDAGYKDIPALTPPARAVAALAVAHHGGRSPGAPPLKPSGGQARAALSYGNKNQYKHPLTSALSDLTMQMWSIGHPGAALDDRRTEDRAANKLGHIKLDWTGGPIRTHMCTCGCTLTPTQ